MSGYVSFNVHAHGDTIVSIYTGGLCVIAHKEKKKTFMQHCWIHGKIPLEEFFFSQKRVHFEIAFYWKTNSFL